MCDTSQMPRHLTPNYPCHHHLPTPPQQRLRYQRTALDIHAAATSRAHSPTTLDTTTPPHTSLNACNVPNELSMSTATITAPTTICLSFLSVSPPSYNPLTKLTSPVLPTCRRCKLMSGILTLPIFILILFNRSAQERIQLVSPRLPGPESSSPQRLLGHHSQQEFIRLGN